MIDIKAVTRSPLAVRLLLSPWWHGDRTPSIPSTPTHTHTHTHTQAQIQQVSIKFACWNNLLPPFISFFFFFLFFGLLRASVSPHGSFNFHLKSYTHTRSTWRPLMFELNFTKASTDGWGHICHSELETRESEADIMGVTAGCALGLNLNSSPPPLQEATQKQALAVARSLHQKSS